MNNSFQEYPLKKISYPNLIQSWILVLWLILFSLVSVALAEILEALKIDANIIQSVQYIFATGSVVLIAQHCKNKISDKPFISYKNKVSARVYALIVPAIICLSGYS